MSGTAISTNSPTGWAAKFTSSVGNGVYISVPPTKTGLNVASGSKNAVVATEDGARLLYAEESSEVWFVDYGFGQLVNGEAIVPIDEIYAQTVNLDQPYHVFVQVYDDATIAVDGRTPEQFTVRLVQGDGDASFSYRIVATRLGHEGERLAQAPWADDDPNLFPELQDDTQQEDALALQEEERELQERDQEVLDVDQEVAAREQSEGFSGSQASGEGDELLVGINAIPTHTHRGETWTGTGTGLTLISSDHIALLAKANAASGNVYGLYGESLSSSGVGVFGYGSMVDSSAYGVFAKSNSTSGIGLHGIATSATGPTVGVGGEAVSIGGTGIIGWATSTTGVSYSIYGESSSVNGTGARGDAAVPAGNCGGVWGLIYAPNGWTGRFTSDYGNGVYISVPPNKIGLSVASGTKNAVVPTEDGARLLYVEEATEVWFSDYGFGQLENGVAFVPIDALYAQTVDLDAEVHVSLQAYGDAQLYVSRRTAAGFEVRARSADANAEFSYRVVAKRAGYAQDRLERAPWADDDPNLFPDRQPQVDGEPLPTIIEPKLQLDKPSPRGNDPRNR